jgi:hypothetical protein
MRDGFVLLNTCEEVNKHRRYVKPVFEDARKGRIWIVVDYSGENDPVLDLLANVRTFEYGLAMERRRRRMSSKRPSHEVLLIAPSKR